VRRVSLPRAGIAPQGGLFGFALAEGHASIVKSKHSVVKMFYWCTARDFIRGRLRSVRQENSGNGWCGMREVAGDGCIILSSKGGF
jgi:hypothetical protein